jgi:hypothetical protein
LHAVFAALVVLVSRWPVITYPRELNADEGQMLAQGMRYLTDAVPWRAVDGTTSGPFNTWFLLLPHGLGANLAYATAHALAALSWALIVLLAYGAVRRHCGPAAAAVAAYTGAMWLAANGDADFVHYSSETLSVLLVTGALAGMASGRAGKCLAAVLLGCVPWAKLQAAPIAAVAGFWLVASELRTSAESSGRVGGSWQFAAALGALAVLPTMAVLAGVTSAGVASDMWGSYFVANARYSGSVASLQFWQQAAAAFGSWRILPWIIMLLVMLAGARWRGRAAAGFWSWHALPAFAVGLGLVSVVAALRPEIRLQHHQLLVVPALMLLTAATVTRLEAVVPAKRVGLGAGILLAVYFVFHVGELRATWFRRAAGLSTPTSASLVLQRVRTVAPGSASLLVWGWFPSIYVESGVTPPTRYVISQFLDSGLPGETERRARFLADFAAASPAVVIDSSERGMERMFGASPRMSGFPDFARLVATNYVSAGTVETPSGPVHIFIRNHAR